MTIKIPGRKYRSFAFRPTLIRSPIRRWVWLRFYTRVYRKDPDDPYGRGATTVDTWLGWGDKP